jgi:DNA polymerase I-like protein with 3'-5' exonuclease and polymerase domains
MLTISNPNTFDWGSIPFDECCKGNALDSYFTLKLFDLCFSKLEERGMVNLFSLILSPALEVFSTVEYEGLNVNLDKTAEIGKKLSDSNIDLEDTLYSCPGSTKIDNFSSNNHLIEVLYTREGGLTLYPPDKTAKGSPSVSAPTLKILLEQIEKELTKRNV